MNADIELPFFGTVNEHKLPKGVALVRVPLIERTLDLLSGSRQRRRDGRRHDRGKAPAAETKSAKASVAMIALLFDSYLRTWRVEHHQVPFPGRSHLYGRFPRPRCRQGLDAAVRELAGFGVRRERQRYRFGTRIGWTIEETLSEPHISIPRAALTTSSEDRSSQRFSLSPHDFAALSAFYLRAEELHKDDGSPLSRDLAIPLRFSFRQAGLTSERTLGDAIHMGRSRTRGVLTRLEAAGFLSRRRLMLYGYGNPGDEPPGHDDFIRF